MWLSHGFEIKEIMQNLSIYMQEDSAIMMKANDMLIKEANIL